jgi:hypothetical protein
MLLHSLEILELNTDFELLYPQNNMRSTAWIFLCIFSSITCLKKPVFTTRGIFCGGRKVTASLSLFLKCEKILALLYLGKGPKYRPFSYT